MNKRIVVALYCACVSVMMFPCLVNAQASLARNAAMGTDMWTQMFGASGLFSPHANTCSATEEFIPITLATGYCIEQNERPAQTWEEARQTCANAGKRLPEPAEWKYACNHGTTVNNMVSVDIGEWASNFPITLSVFDGVGGVAAPVLGANYCYFATYSMVGYSSPAKEDSVPFRCVH